MQTKSRKRFIYAVLAVLIVVVGPSAAWSMEALGSEASPAEQQTIEMLSRAFRSVAAAVRPSVVSIRVKKYPAKVPGEMEMAPERLRHLSPEQQKEFNEQLRRFLEKEYSDPRSPGPGQNPEKLREQLREFFGPDSEFFERGVVPRSQSPRRKPVNGLGSGIIVDAKRGYVLTNYHVIQGADEIQVKLHNGYRYEAKELGHDARADLAIIIIDAADLKEARLGNSAQAEAGDIVLAIGSPWGLEQTVTQGIISAKGRSIGGLVDRRVSDAVAIQTDAAVNPGNSGGPLVNIKGEVIGINRAIRPQGAMTPSYAGVVFAVPINHAKKVMKHIISGEPLKRGYLGISMHDLADMDSALLKTLGVEHRPGVIVRNLLSGQPADRAGLAAGDVILEVDGQAIEDSATLQRIIAGTSPGTTVGLTIVRNKKVMEIPVELGERSVDVSRTSLVAEKPPAPAIIEKMGLQVSELTAERAKQIGVAGDTEGLLVEKVLGGGLGYMLSIRPNDVIVELQQQKVSTVEEFNARVAELDEAEGLSITIVNRSGERFLFMPPRR